MRRAIADHQERFYDLSYDADSEVLVTAGATEASTRSNANDSTSRNEARTARLPPLEILPYEVVPFDADIRKSTLNIS